MKKIIKPICGALAAIMLLITLCSCAEREPGLYTWYGKKINAEYILKMTVDVGDGEVVYNVPLDTYRDLFMYYGTIVSDVVVDENDVKSLTSESQKTIVLKEYTEDELCDYYALLAIAEKYGVGLTDEDSERFETDYTARIASYADQLNDQYSSDFKGTKEEYAKYLYEQAIEKAGITPEYLEYMYYRNLLETRVKKAVAPDLISYAEQSYYHFKQIYIGYMKGDDAAEKSASENAYAAYSELLGGADFDDMMKKYTNNSVYGGEFYYDSYGNIIGSSSNSSVGATTDEAVKALAEDEYSTVLMGDEDDETAYFAIIMRCGFTESFLYGSSSAAKQIFQYPYYGASTYSVYYTVYSDLFEAYKQNMRIEPYDEDVYKLVKYGAMY